MTFIVQIVEAFHSLPLRLDCILYHNMVYVLRCSAKFASFCTLFPLFVYKQNALTNILNVT